MGLRDRTLSRPHGHLLPAYREKAYPPRRAPSHMSVRRAVTKAWMIRHRPTTRDQTILQPLPGLGDARGGAAALAGGHAGERDELPPAEGGTRRGELLADGPVVLLGVEGARPRSRRSRAAARRPGVRCGRACRSGGRGRRRGPGPGRGSRLRARPGASSGSTSLIGSRSARRGRGDQWRKSPPRLTRSRATW